ncbi:hypothetical protein ACPC54_07780 [Kitasatospora sp. NPDC094028]
MTATNDAPDPHPTGPDRWQPIVQRPADLETRIRTLGIETTATLDTYLARLDALRHQPAHPASASVPASPAPSSAPEADG